MSVEALLHETGYGTAQDSINQSAHACRQLRGVRDKTQSLASEVRRSVAVTASQLTDSVWIDANAFNRQSPENIHDEE